MKQIARTLLVVAGIGSFMLAAGYFFQMEWATNTWPWPDGRLSYIFIASILAAIGIAVVWIGLTAEWEPLIPCALNLLVMMAGIGVFLFSLARQVGQAHLLVYAIGASLVALFNLLLFLWAHRLPIRSHQPTPKPVLISFALFTIILVSVGVSLIRQTANIMPWPLRPDTSVMFGWIFFGDAFYFLYALLRRSWPFARAQLWSFLAYDLVLIGPFLAHLNTVPPELSPNLLIYLLVLLYSGGLALYYLFINQHTRALPANVTQATVDRKQPSNWG